MLQSLALLALLLLAAAPAPAPAQPAIRGVTVEGTDFRVALADGAVLRGADLVGAELDLGAAGRVRVEAASPDPGDPRGEVWLFDLRARDAAGAWAPLCGPDPDGRRLAFPLADPGNPARWTLLCTAGALGKGVRFGYAPWRTAPDGRPMAPWHAACARAVRGDYGGDGAAWTRDGTRIDIYDRIGVQRPEADDPMPFEAGWTPHGAACVAHARVPENATLDALAARYPRLAAARGPEACTEEAAAAAGALIFVRSARD